MKLLAYGCKQFPAFLKVYLEICALLCDDMSPMIEVGLLGNVTRMMINAACECYVAND